MAFSTAVYAKLEIRVGTAAAMARRYRVSQVTISRLLATQRASSARADGGAPVSDSSTTAERVANVLPASALDERLAALVGTSGSGKTYAAKGLLEPVMHLGGRVYVVDPLAMWWGLKQAAETGPAPFPATVFGGDHADVPLDLPGSVPSRRDSLREFTQRRLTGG